MDAVEWVEAEPGQDGGLEVGGASMNGLGDSLSFRGGDPHHKERGSQLGDTSGPSSYHENPGGVRGPFRLFSSMADSPAATIS